MLNSRIGLLRLLVIALVSFCLVKLPLETRLLLQDTISRDLHVQGNGADNYNKIPIQQQETTISKERITPAESRSWKEQRNKHHSQKATIRENKRSGLLSKESHETTSKEAASQSRPASNKKPHDSVPHGRTQEAKSATHRASPSPKAINLDEKQRRRLFWSKVQGLVQSHLAETGAAFSGDTPIDFSTEIQQIVDLYSSNMMAGSASSSGLTNKISTIETQPYQGTQTNDLTYAGGIETKSHLATNFTDEIQDMVNMYLLPPNGSEVALEDNSTLIQPQKQNNNTLLFQKQKDQRLYVFYHIYIPPDPEHALSVIEEQLNQVGSASAVSTSSGPSAQYNSTTVFYNTIGKKVNETFVEQVCQNNNLQCHYLNHYEKGFEFITLQDIQEFCTYTAIHDNHNVVYLHSKGTFHSQKESNVHLRRSMTTATTSNECHTALEQDTCNTCGLIFSAIRSPFYPGNFWAAQCRYIDQLLDPFEFRLKLEKATKRARRLRTRGKLTLHLLPELPSTLGLGRYAAEFWAGSHPSIRPCDVSNPDKHTWKYWKNYDANFNDMDLAPAPREEISQTNLFLPKTTDERLREWFLLAGYIMKWYRLYNQVPSDDSWVWSYFPEGDIWKEAVKQHGRHAVVEVLHKGVLAIQTQQITVVVPKKKRKMRKKQIKKS
jgi:hypothetical protein